NTGTIQFGNGVNGRLPPGVSNNLAAAYANPTNSTGLMFVTRRSANLVFEWQVTNPVVAAELAFGLIGTNGTAQLLRWSVTNVPSGACLRFDSSDPLANLLVDNDCDGTPELLIPATSGAINELQPQILAVLQDPSVHAGRPSKPCNTP